MKIVPTLLLVHGAWHRKEMWNLLIRELPGVSIRTVQLPSSAPVPVEQLGDFYDDAKAIRDAAEAIEGPVVVVAHSYGAAPATQGLVGVPSVKRLVYITGYLPNVGDTFIDLLEGNIPDFFGMEHKDDGYIEMLRPEEIFYSDLTSEAAKEAADALLPHSWPSLIQPMTQAAWDTIPCSYIVTTKDYLPAAAQEILAKKAKADIARINTSHSPFLSQPAELAELLRQELERVTEA